MGFSFIHARFATPDTLLSLRLGLWFKVRKDEMHIVMCIMQWCCQCDGLNGTVIVENFRIFRIFQFTNVQQSRYHSSHRIGNITTYHMPKSWLKLQQNQLTLRLEFHEKLHICDSPVARCCLLALNHDYIGK